MRIRHLISAEKALETDTDWQTIDLQHRHAPIFPKTTPIRAGWKWRSAKARGATGEFILLAKSNPNRDNWQAVLMVVVEDGSASFVGRFEHHGSHPGLHAHAHCERSGIDLATPGLDDLARVPAAGPGSYHRRQNAWTERGFWEAAKRFFRVREQWGTLI